MRNHTETDVVRSPDVIARRALALFAVTGVAAGADRDQVLDWLKENHLKAEVTPMELHYLSAATPSTKDTINMSWRSERLIVLLWSLDLVASLPPADEQCDTSIFELLPPFGDGSVVEFISLAKLRPEAELWEMADQCLKLHWIARDAKSRGCSPKEAVDLEIIQERHHAINWVTGYDDGVPWDEVTTDTYWVEQPELIDPTTLSG